MTLYRIACSLLTENRCLVCGRILPFSLEYRYNICPPCRKSFDVLPGGSRCVKCSILLISEDKKCMRCRKRKYSFDYNYSIFRYAGAIKELIYQYKFKHNKRLAYFFAEIFYLYFFRYIKAEMIVPVPSARSSIRKRGFDHMACIAEILEGEYRLPVEYCMSRKNGKPQKGLNYRERLTNLVDSIYLKKNRIPFPRTVILIDDVFTTGATVKQCSDIIIKAGADRVISLTVAID